MHYHFKVYTADKGKYWAQGVELPGCITEARSVAALEANLKEVLDLYLSEPPDSRFVFPAPRKRVLGRNIVRVLVDPGVALSMQLRQARLRMKLSQKRMAARLGFKNVAAYQKLERPTTNPTLQTLYRIKQVVPELPVDELLAS